MLPSKPGKRPYFLYVLSIQMGDVAFVAITEPTSKDRRRFAFERANELWLSNVMHAIPVETEERRQRKTYLIALLDDATRVVPYAEFAFSEKVAAFLPVLEQGIRRRGIPHRLYADNGAVYRSHHLALVCAKLGIPLIHSRPYVPLSLIHISEPTRPY